MVVHAGLEVINALQFFKYGTFSSTLSGHFHVRFNPRTGGELPLARPSTPTSFIEKTIVRSAAQCAIHIPPSIPRTVCKSQLRIDFN